jgi:organic radical activating enzyme
VRRRTAQVQHDPGLAVLGPDPDIFDSGCRLRCGTEQDQDTTDEKTRKSHREATTQALVYVASVYENRSEIQQYSFQN